MTFRGRPSAEHVRRAPPGDDLDRGTVTVELALGLPAVVTVLVAVLLLATAASAQLRCADRRAPGARAAALGEDVATGHVDGDTGRRPGSHRAGPARRRLGGGGRPSAGHDGAAGRSDMDRRGAGRRHASSRERRAEERGPHRRRRRRGAGHPGCWSGTSRSRPCCSPPSPCWSAPAVTGRRPVGRRPGRSRGGGAPGGAPSGAGSPSRRRRRRRPRWRRATTRTSSGAARNGAGAVTVTATRHARGWARRGPRRAPDRRSVTGGAGHRDGRGRPRGCTVTDLRDGHRRPALRRASSHRRTAPRRLSPRGAGDGRAQPGAWRSTASRSRSARRASRAGCCRCRTWATGRTRGSRRAHRQVAIASRVAREPRRAEVVAALGEARAAGIGVVDEHRRVLGVDVHRGRHPAQVPPVARREQRQQADRRVLGRVQRAGRVLGVEAGLLAAPRSGAVHQTPTVLEGLRRQVQRLGCRAPACRGCACAGSSPPGGHVDGAEPPGDRPPLPVLAGSATDLDGRQPRVPTCRSRPTCAGRTSGDAVGQVEARRRRRSCPGARRPRPGAAVASADDASTVPSTRPVALSTTRTGSPPVPRRSVSRAALSAWVQYQPDVRRRSAPRSTRTSSSSRVPGPKSGAVLDRAAAARRRPRTGAARARTGSPGRRPSPRPPRRRSPPGGARGRCPAGPRARRGRPGPRCRPVRPGRPAATGTPAYRASPR